MKELLVIGVNKAGKTSVIEGLADAGSHQTKPVDDFIAESFQQRIVEYKAATYRFTEAPGLAEAVKNDKDEDQKLAHLEQLAMYSEHNFDLILFVSRNGTIHSNTKDMYTIVKHVMRKNIPMIGVITGCENELDLDRWAQKNRPHYERSGMKFNELIGTCFGRGGRMESVFAELRQESAIDLWKVIQCVLYPTDGSVRNNTISTEESSEQKKVDKTLSKKGTSTVTVSKHGPSDHRDQQKKQNRASYFPSSFPYVKLW